MHKTKSGFTIVELLIVIVVIAILAAISIIAYNGIQQRAHNSQIASVIQSYKKALIQYAIERQAYPTTGNVCLGDEYPDMGAYTVANGRNCFRSNSTGGIMNASFNNGIRPYLSNKVPTPNNTIFGDGSSPWSLRGATFFASSTLVIDGVANPWAIVYAAEGQTQCPVGPVLNLAGFPNITSTPPSTGYSVLISGGTVGVECWIAMPDPTKL